MGKKLKVTIEGEDFEKPFVLEGHGDAVKISKAVYALVPDAHEPLDLLSLLQKAKEWGLCELGFWSIDDASQVLKFEPYPDVSISPADLEAVKKFLEGDVMAFEDVDLADDEKAFICLHNLYPDLKDIPTEDMQAAFDTAIQFIDAGQLPDGEGPSARTMDWVQDAPLIFPAINRSAGFEVRGVDYMHWWTFLAAYMEINDCTFTTVISIRQKQAKHKKLEKWEQDYVREHPELVKLRPLVSESEQAYLDSFLE